MDSVAGMSELNVSKVAPQWHDFLRHALLEWEATSFAVRGALGGQSSSKVMLVEVRTPKHDGLGVLKLSPEDPKNDEASRQEEARSLLPQLSANIPNITHTYTEDSSSATLMTVAGGGLLEAQVLSTASAQLLNLAGQTVSRTLLSRWNPQPNFDGGLTTADAILREWLGHRIGPTGRIPDVMRNLLNISPDCHSFRYDGEDYPNPYQLGTTSTSGKRIDLSAGRGLLHGDLHMGNILIRGPRIIESYYFIDFSHFKRQAPLFFDHAYLELSLLLDKRNGVTHHHWHRLCQYASRLESTHDASGGPDADDHGLLWTLGMIRAEIRKWINRKYPDRMQDLKKQILLSRIAAGINFANKRHLAPDLETSNKKKTFALLYASTVAKELFKYCQIPVQDDGPVAKPQGEIEQPAGNEWRRVWNECGNFESQNAAYVLVTGGNTGELSRETHTMLGRLPWSLVIDFDRAGPDGRFLRNANPMLRRNRNLLQIFPHQTTSVDFESGICWLFADSDHTGIEPEPPALPEWRRRTLPKIRTLASSLHQYIAPRPVYLVVLGRYIDPVRLRNTFVAIEEAMGGAFDTVVVSQDEGDTTHEILAQETTSEIANVVCNWTDLALGLHQMFGDVAEGHSLWIPIRDTTSAVVRRELVAPDQAALYSGTIEIVPASGSTYDNGDVDSEVADFLRGNTITWHELDLHRDVDRDINHGPDGLAQRLRALLGTSPTESLAIEHSPGAGGTTVARRVAWELRDEFPCVILNSYTDNTVDAIETLFQRSKLPLLILAEANRLPGAQRDSFFNELKERNIRFVILDVRRRHHPHNSTTSVSLADPMSNTEALRFLAQYKPRTPHARQNDLVRLASSEGLAPYRSAFFFGLYAFEKEFVRVEEFVESTLSEVTIQARDAVAHLALITRYSQKRMPVDIFLALIGFKPRKERFTVSKALGEAAVKLVIFDGTCLGISHPLLAEEILRQHLSPSSSELVNVWLVNLAEFCMRFIDEMSGVSLGRSTKILEILTDLFIERGVWQGSTHHTLFSSLLNELPSPESQRRILENLCEKFPSNAHFWGHLGRHINLSGIGSFEEAEAALKKAIELEPEDDVHHHGLGMVYRLEVKRQLQTHLSPDEEARERLEKVRSSFEKAENCFKIARTYNPASPYPLVTPVQMILESIERFAALSKINDYTAFLCGQSHLSEWCREKITESETLVAQLRHQEANSYPTQYRQQCEARLYGVAGDFEGMVAGLSSLLRMPAVAKSPVRRMLANAYVRRLDAGEIVVEQNSFQHVVSLMQENLANDPTNGHDTHTWFRAFRMLSGFTITEAIERMTHWSLVSNNVEALYYLYVLHFVNSRHGVRNSVREAKRYLEMCKQFAPLRLSKKSFEWWAADSLGRQCPLVHHSELGLWSMEQNFFTGVQKLGHVEGRIDDIRSPQVGTIMVDGMKAFFVPRSDFQRFSDLNVQVKFYLGFSYEGLRAWSVRRVAAN